MTTRRMLALLQLLMLALFLGGTSCTPSEPSWQPPRPVKIEGGKVWYNLFPSWYTWGSVIVEGKTGGMLLRDGDLVSATGDNNVGGSFVYQASDGPALKATFGEGRVLLADKVVSVSLEEGEGGWDWLEKASTQDLSEVRLIGLPDELDAVRLLTLKKLAAASPNVGLVIGTKSVLLQVFPLFKPRVLVLGEMPWDADVRKVLSNQKQMELLLISGEEPGSLDFLPGLPSLRRLAILEWDVEKAGPLPKDIKGLKSLHVIGSTMKDVSALANAPAGLEELSLLECKTLSDVSGLAKLKGLKTVILNGSKEVLNLSGLAGLRELRWVGLPPGIFQEQFIAFIKAHPNLKFLEMVKCGNLLDLTPLRDLKGIEGLVLVGEYKNLDVVQGLKSLRFVAISDKVFTEATGQVVAIQNALPNALVVPAAPMCLGSGWILLLLPAIVLVWLIRSRLVRRAAAGRHHD